MATPKKSMLIRINSLSSGEETKISNECRDVSLYLIDKIKQAMDKGSSKTIEGRNALRDAVGNELNQMVARILSNISVEIEWPEQKKSGERS